MRARREETRRQYRTRTGPDIQIDTDCGLPSGSQPWPPIGVAAVCGMPSGDPASLRGEGIYPATPVTWPRARRLFEVRHSPKGRVMRKFTVVLLIANVWFSCGSLAHSQEPALMPAPAHPSSSGTARAISSSQTSIATGISTSSRSIS